MKIERILTTPPVPAPRAKSEHATTVLPDAVTYTPAANDEKRKQMTYQKKQQKRNLEQEVVTEFVEPESDTKEEVHSLDILV